MTSAARKLDSPVLLGQPGDRIAIADGNVVEVIARAKLPTRHGDFDIMAFSNSLDGQDHVAIVRGNVAGAQEVPVRVHSECLTGDVFGSMRCDCGEQLEQALDDIANQASGVIVYLRQEGRGIGLANKVRAYALQDSGLDTVEANRHLGFDDDLREYSVAAAMLELLGIGSIVLYTNNPNKVAGLQSAGLRIAERRGIEMAPNDHNRFYLQTKRDKSGHILKVD